MESVVVLQYQMLSNIPELIKTIKPENVDISAIQRFDSEFENFDTVRSQDFERLGKETIHAIDVVLDWYHIASRFAKYAHTQYDKMAAYLYLNEVPAKLAAAGVKDSDSARSRILDQEDEYVKYKEIRDAWQVFAEFLDKKRDSFLQKHMYIKKMIDIKLAERQ